MRLITYYYIKTREFLGQLGGKFIWDNNYLSIADLVWCEHSFLYYDNLMGLYEGLQPLPHLILPHIFQSARTDDQNGQTFLIEQTASQWLDWFPHSHLVSNQYSTVTGKTELKSLPLEGVKLRKERVFWNIELVASVFLTIDLEDVEVSSHHLYEVRRSLEVRLNHLR